MLLRYEAPAEAGVACRAVQRVRCVHACRAAGRVRARKVQTRRAALLPRQHARLSAPATQAQVFNELKEQKEVRR
jgi:hypothetical protein